ncbi:MAG: LysR family transcriptional regulator [Marinovum sp.]|nr:LysR family transcriptional regulator [Marinovum sp.]
MLRLNLEQLRTFLMVVRSGGVVRAAQSLNVTQPAVTARIRALEETLGTPVFDRAAGSARLTKRGELLLQHAQRLEALANNIERDVVDPEGVEGHLRIGASETIAQSWLPDFVSELNATFPQLRIELNVDVSINLRNAVLAREIDLAFLLGPISEYSVQNVALPSFALDWYASGSADLTKGAASRLFDKPVITYAKNTRPFRELSNEVQTRIGGDVALFPSSSLSAAIRLVTSGLGVAALPKSLADPLVASGELCTFDPGWVPEPLLFTASYVADPPSQVTDKATEIAISIAKAHAGT